MGFSRQEYWSQLLFPPPGDLPDPGTEPSTSKTPALAGEFFTAEPPKKALKCLEFLWTCVCPKLAQFLCICFSFVIECFFSFSFFFHFFFGLWNLISEDRKEGQVLHVQLTTSDEFDAVAEWVDTVYRQARDMTLALPSCAHWESYLTFLWLTANTMHQLG